MLILQKRTPFADWYPRVQPTINGRPSSRTKEQKDNKSAVGPPSEIRKRPRKSWHERPTRRANEQQTAANGRELEDSGQ